MYKCYPYLICVCTNIQTQREHLCISLQFVRYALRGQCESIFKLLVLQCFLIRMFCCCFICSRFVLLLLYMQPFYFVVALYVVFVCFVVGLYVAFLFCCCFIGSLFVLLLLYMQFFCFFVALYVALFFCCFICSLFVLLLLYMQPFRFVVALYVALLFWCCLICSLFVLLLLYMQPFVWWNGYDSILSGGIGLLFPYVKWTETVQSTVDVIRHVKYFCYTYLQILQQWVYLFIYFGFGRKLHVCSIGLTSR